MELLPEARDVGGDECGRMGIDLERVILRVNPERIEADGLEDVPSLQAMIPAADVRADEREHVTDVQPLRRRVRVHHELEERPVCPLEVGRIGAPLLPAAAPFRLDRLRVVCTADTVGVGHGGRNLPPLAAPGSLPYLAQPYASRLHGPPPSGVGGRRALRRPRDRGRRGVGGPRRAIRSATIGRVPSGVPRTTRCRRGRPLPRGSSPGRPHARPDAGGPRSGSGRRGDGGRARPGPDAHRGARDRLPLRPLTAGRYRARRVSARVPGRLGLRPHLVHRATGSQRGRHECDVRLRPGGRGLVADGVRASVVRVRPGVRSVGRHGGTRPRRGDLRLGRSRRGPEGVAADGRPRRDPRDRRAD